MSTVIPLLEVILLGVPILLGLVRGLPNDERIRMTRVLLIGFGLRLFVAVLFDTFESTRMFHEDAYGYETTGRRLAAAWWGEAPPIVLQTNGLRSPSAYPGFLMFCASLYYVFGRFRLVVTAFMSLFGTVTVFMVYRLAARTFHRRVADRAALLTAFFPSMVLWSAMSLKDPIMIMLIVIALDSVIELRQAFRLSVLLLLVIAVIGMWFIRFYVVYSLALAAIASLIVARGKNFLGSFSRQLTAIVVLGLAFSLLGMGGGIVASTDSFDLARVSDYRHGMAITANSGFAVDSDLSTPGGALAFLPIGMSVLLFGPFPWQMVSLRPLLALPEMLVWWAMVPALFRGIRFALRREFVNVAPIVTFGATLIMLYSLTLGNVGAAFRQRAQVFVFLFIFAALGHYVGVCRKRGIDLDELRVNPTAG